MKSFSIREFKPTIVFLVKFIGFYLIGNLIYGLYITLNYPAPDHITQWVSNQTSALITFCGWTTTSISNPNKPITQIMYHNHEVLNIYEGCNGINTMIVFVSFIVAFGPINKKLVWFIPLGLLIIHGGNLMRIGLLFFVAEYRPDAMYFIHKYVFTATLYIVIFMLWVWWVKRFSLGKE